MKRREFSTSISAVLAVSSLMFILVFALSGCSSSPKPVPEDLEPIEYFQEAQKMAMEDGDYKNAIRYYRVFIQRHPDDIQHVVEAQYEIAFLHYKQGQYTRAREEFNKLLSYYEGGGQSVLPEWPQILAQKIMKKMEDERPSSSSGSGESNESTATGEETGSSSSGGSEDADQ